jgi:hypothetical protein
MEIAPFSKDMMRSSVNLAAGLFFGGCLICRFMYIISTSAVLTGAHSPKGRTSIHKRGAR